MNKCEKCEANFPNWIDIDGKKRNLSSRKYCLECTPFGTHNTKKLDGTSFKESGIAKCSVCNNDLTKDLFYKRRGDDRSSYCKRCTNKEAADRCRKLKLQYIEIKVAVVKIADILNVFLLLNFITKTLVKKTLPYLKVEDHLKESNLN